jgi:uncharacterized protein
MFTWDPDKNEENKRRHGIAFEDAISTFDGPTIEDFDRREDYGEDRWILTGFLQGVVVVVVYTERGDVTRIISARKAKLYERKEFEERLGSL